MKSQLSPPRATAAPPASPGPPASPAMRALPASVAAEWPLVGRLEELACVWTVLNETQPSGILLSGAAGVGKSRLAHEVAAQARTSGWAVLWIKATEATRDINFGAVSRWIEPSAVGTMTSAERLARLGERLRARSRSQRVLLTVDDAHLLDAGTASLIQQYGSGRNRRVVSTVRRGSVASDAVRAVWTSPQVRRIEMHPLTMGQIDELLGTILGGRIDRPSRRALWRLCAGNVLLLRELVLGGLTAGDLSPIDGVWHWQAETPVIPSVRELICSRIAVLTPTERAALEAIAIGEPLPEMLVKTMMSEQDLLALERAGLVRWDPDSPGTLLRLAHPLFADAVRELTPLLAAHRARRSLAAATLADPGSSAGSQLRAVVWLLDAGATPDADLLAAAARHAGRLSAHRVQERIARAGRAAYGGYDFSLLLAQALGMQAKWEETAQLRTRPPLSDADTRERRCEVAALHAEVLAWGFGRPKDALDLLARATLGYRGPAGAQCSALRGAIALFCSDLTQAVSASEQVLATPGLSDDLAIRGLICAVPSLALMGRTSDAVDRANRGQALMAAGDVVPSVWRADLVYGHVCALRMAGRYRAALRVAEAFYESADDTGLTASALAAVAFAQALLDTGSLPRAEAMLLEALALFRREDLTGVLPWCRGLLAQTLALAGRVDAAVDLLASPDGDGSVAPIYRPEMARARSWVAAATGELTTGADLARQAAELAMQLEQPAVAARAWHDLARMGEPGAAATQLAMLTDTTQSAEPGLFQDHAAALAAQDGPGLDRSYQRFASRGALLLAAEASAAASAAYRATGHPAKAEQSRRRVTGCVTACDGATTPALRQIPTSDPMSRRETEVAALAGHGLTNAQIATKLHLSVRTVEGHLQHVYTKLELHGRGELPS